MQFEHVCLQGQNYVHVIFDSIHKFDCGTQATHEYVFTFQENKDLNYPIENVCECAWGDLWNWDKTKYTEEQISMINEARNKLIKHLNKNDSKENK